jgi:putative transposase
MLKEVLGLSERLACKAVGLARCTYRRTPVAQAPADPDAQLRAWLRDYSAKHPCHGFRRAWAVLRHDECWEVTEFDSTIDGKAIKIASMLDEHTGESLLNIVSARSPLSG